MFEADEGSVFLLLFLLSISACIAWITRCRRWIPITLGCIGLALGGMIGLSVLEERTRRPAIERFACKGSLWNLRNAMVKYEEDHGSFSPRVINDESGRPLHSWRVLLLPYLEYRDTYDLYDFDQPWNAEANLRLQSRMPADYRHFSCGPRPSTANGDVDSQWMTSVMAVEDGVAVKENDEVRIVAGNDGHPSHLALACTSHLVHWMAPEDVTATELTEEVVNREGRHSGGVNILCDDGQILFWTKE